MGSRGDRVMFRKRRRACRDCCLPASKLDAVGGMGNAACLETGSKRLPHLLRIAMYRWKAC